MTDKVLTRLNSNGESLDESRPAVAAGSAAGAAVPVVGAVERQAALARPRPWVLGLAGAVIVILSGVLVVLFDQEQQPPIVTQLEPPPTISSPREEGESEIVPAQDGQVIPGLGTWVWTPVEFELLGAGDGLVDIPPLSTIADAASGLVSYEWRSQDGLTWTRSYPDPLVGTENWYHVFSPPTGGPETWVAIGAIRESPEVVIPLYTTDAISWLELPEPDVAPPIPEMEGLEWTSGAGVLWESAVSSRGMLVHTASYTGTVAWDAVVGTDLAVYGRCPGGTDCALMVAPDIDDALPVSIIDTSFAPEGDVIEFRSRNTGGLLHTVSGQFPNASAEQVVNAIVKHGAARLDLIGTINANGKDTWVVAPWDTPATETSQLVAFDNAFFALVLPQAELWRSEDGVSWSLVNEELGRTPPAPMTLSTDGTVLRSTRWVLQSSEANPEGANTIEIRESTDGITWTLVGETPVTRPSLRVWDQVHFTSWGALAQAYGRNQIELWVTTDYVGWHQVAVDDLEDAHIVNDMAFRRTGRVADQ